MARFRADLRLAGLAVDAQAAQQMLAGRALVDEPFSAVVEQVRRGLLLDNRVRHEVNRTWEENHPGSQPFPAPFPQRVFDRLGAFLTLLEGGAEPQQLMLLIMELRDTCNRELADDGDTVVSTHR